MRAKSQINSAQSLPPVGIHPGTLGRLVIHSLAFLTELTWQSVNCGIFNFTFVCALIDF